MEVMQSHYYYYYHPPCPRLEQEIQLNFPPITLNPKPMHT
jgi:hypothetical protein